MRQTWRWFGPKDPMTLNEIRQTGATEVVTALHGIAAGEVWHLPDILARKSLICGEKTGLDWKVVESLPVSEDIKLRSGDWKAHQDNYATSLRNLAEAGIDTVCYNFMPVLDWTRTALAHPLANGATCMRFDHVDFVVFDVHVLKRKAAEQEYGDTLLQDARRRHAEMAPADMEALSSNILCGLPGAVDGLSLAQLHALLEQYKDVDGPALRANLIAFLTEIAPVAQDLGVRLCCHPDDPPMPLLGLPRIMSTERDFQTIMDAVDIEANGITLCSGSLGARADNDLVAMMERLGDRVHFLHLRNVRLETRGADRSFHEADHLGGQVDMVGLVAAVLDQEARRKQSGRADWNIPFRPDHGQNILDDHTRETQPGYPAIGRLKGLAELRGIIAALSANVAG